MFEKKPHQRIKAPSQIKITSENSIKNHSNQSNFLSVKNERQQKIKIESGGIFKFGGIYL